MTKLARLLNKIEAERRFIPDNRFILPDCRIGLEFEFEHTGDIARTQRLPATPWSHYWEWHEEGSIRDGGSEFVFVEPLFGLDAYLAIEGLCGFADQKRWRSTLRTGLHVHLDVRDLEVHQLVGFCVLYAIFEPAIFNWIGDNRENSHFCIPWYRAEGSILEAAAILRSALQPPAEGPSTEMIRNSERYHRYAALNLQALYKFGSIEARHMRTCTDITRIMQWTNLLMALKRATTRVPQSDTAIVREVAHIGARQAIINYFGPEFLFLDYAGLDVATQDKGIATANELIREGLTVNLWERMANSPQGRNPGFMRFEERVRQEGVRFEEPENNAPIVPAGLLDDELNEDRARIPNPLRMRVNQVPPGVQLNLQDAQPIDPDLVARMQRALDAVQAAREFDIRNAPQRGEQ